MKKHPLNQSFVWQQPDPPYELITETQARAYRSAGGFVLEDAFSAEEMNALLAALDPLADEANACLSEVPSDRPSIARRDEIVFRPHLVAVDATAREFAKHPVFQALCRDLIGSPVRLYWDQLVYKYPDTQPEFPWHQDNGYTYVEPQQYLTCWVALTDADERNGCPWIAPGLHSEGTLRHRWTDLGFDCLGGVDTPAHALPVSAGSIAVFSSLTPHRTGPNETDTCRKAYILQYAPDGAQVHPRDGEPFAANDPDRQFLVA